MVEPLNRFMEGIPINQQTRYLLEENTITIEPG